MSLRGEYGWLPTPHGNPHCSLCSQRGTPLLGCAENPPYPPVSSRHSTNEGARTIGASGGGWGPPTRAAKTAKAPRNLGGWWGFGGGRRGSPTRTRERWGFPERGEGEPPNARSAQFVGSADTLIFPPRPHPSLRDTFSNREGNLVVEAPTLPYKLQLI